MDGVFYLKGSYQVSFGGRVAKLTWQERGPALATFDLLARGLGHITESGSIIWVRIP